MIYEASGIDLVYSHRRILHRPHITLSSCVRVCRCDARIFEYSYEPTVHLCKSLNEGIGDVRIVDWSRGRCNVL